jgi:uncharacterized membrane protein YeiH
MDIWVFSLADIVGTIAFAMSGFLIGVRKNLDIMGIFIVAMMTSTGGGVIRDVLIGRTPLVLVNPNLFYTVTIIFLLSMVMKIYKYSDLEARKWFVLSDSMGLVSFGITGSLAAIQYDLNLFGVMVLAFVTAAGGGIIRDMMVNELPAILKSDFYGTVALVVAIITYGMNMFGYLTNQNMLLLFFGALALRLYAYHKGWGLPGIKYDNKEH